MIEVNEGDLVIDERSYMQAVVHMRISVSLDSDVVSSEALCS